MTTNLIFDADDTLWETEILYDEARRQFVESMVTMELGDASEIEDLSKKIDANNFKKLGFSTTRFPQSLADTYEALCKKKKVAVDQKTRADIISIGASVFNHPAKLIDNVRQALEHLKAENCQLFLWTQGDPSIQKRRLADSGLVDLFTAIEITDTKSAKTLAKLLRKWNIAEVDTWLIGNSVKSDINPALEIGVRAIWIPSNVWVRERDTINMPASSKELAYQVDEISEVAQIVLRVDNDAEIERQLESPDSVVYLFVSAYHNLYRQYVLDILCYPRHFIFKFPYDDRRWLPSPYRDDLTKRKAFASALGEKKAMVVFVDERTVGEPRRFQRFIPIRTATIHAPVDLQGGMIYIQFELGDYVHYPNADTVRTYDEVIHSLPARPQLNPEDSAYIALGPSFKNKISTSEASISDDDAWQTIVDKLGQLNSIPRRVKPNRYAPERFDPFEKAMFFRIVSIVESSSHRQLSLQNVLDDESGYEIKGRSNYRLNLLFFYPRQPHSLVRRSKVCAQFSSEFVNGVGAQEIPLNFRYDRRHIDFVTDRVFTNMWTSASLSVSQPNNGPSLLEAEQVVAPQPTLLFKVKATRWVNILAPIIFAVATIVSTLNAQFAQMIVSLIPSAASYQAQIGAGLAVIGSSTATVILFYLYGQLK